VCSLNTEPYTAVWYCDNACMDVGANCLLSPMNTIAMSPVVVIGTTGTYLNYRLEIRYLSKERAMDDNHGNRDILPALTL